MAAAGLLAILYLMSAAAVVSTAISAVTDPVTIKLFLALTLIRVLEIVLREHGVLANMTEAARQILRNRKAVIISKPLLIGLLPSLGGAYFSAPMVEESTKGLKMSPEEKGFINYWYRHPWEYVLPLYPGILLASAVSNIPLRSLVLANASYAMVIFIAGFLFSMKGVGGKAGQPAHLSAVLSGESANSASSLRLVASFLPVVLVLILVIGMHVELHIALALTVALLYLFFRSGIRDIVRTGHLPISPWGAMSCVQSISTVTMPIAHSRQILRLAARSSIFGWFRASRFNCASLSDVPRRIREASFPQR